MEIINLTYGDAFAVLIIVIIIFSVGFLFGLSNEREEEFDN